MTQLSPQKIISPNLSPSDSSPHPDCNQGRQLIVLVCPGFHERSLTDSFVRSLPAFVTPHVLDSFPADPLATFNTVKQRFQHQPAVVIAFSAGVVGAVGALSLWQSQGGHVKRLFAVDGWGVPTLGLPVCRLSHDAFTHWSSVPLGIGNTNFYADPAVKHLTLWKTPAQVQGWQIGPSAPSLPFTQNAKFVTATAFLHDQLQKSFHEISRQHSGYEP